MRPDPHAPRARLMVWTDVDPAHAQDFDRWYDREHMQERIAIPGFRVARRLRALDACPRPYLALYDTDGLAVFRSEAYRRAFEAQTEWSRRNFARMRDTQRRVGALTIDPGAAADGTSEGGALALFVVPEPTPGDDALGPRLRAIAERDHVVRATLMRTDAALSMPLDASAPRAGADAVVTIEATDPRTALREARALAGALGVEPGGVHGFGLMWRAG